MERCGPGTGVARQRGDRILVGLCALDSAHRLPDQSVRVHTPHRLRSIEQLSSVGFMWRLGIELPWRSRSRGDSVSGDTAGVVQAPPARLVRSLVMTNVVFALWHLVVAAHSVQQNVGACRRSWGRRRLSSRMSRHWRRWHWGLCPKLAERMDESPGGWHGRALAGGCYCDPMVLHTIVETIDVSVEHCRMST